MSIRDIRKLQRQGYTDYTQEDENFFQNIDPSFEGYKNYGVVADKRSAVDEAVQQAGGYYEAPDTTQQDASTLTVLGTAAANYGKWEPYASSLLQKGFPKASFSSTQPPFAPGTYGTTGAKTTLGAAAGKYYSNLTSGTAAGIGPGVGTALVGYGIKKVFGDDDPTTYTAAEQIGTGVQAVGTAATIANIAGIALGPVGLAAAAFLGWRSGKKKQKKAIKEAQQRRQEEIAEIYEENRINYGELAKQEEYFKNRAMFENPYGATASSQYDYVPSYAHGGYHFNYQGLFGEDPNLLDNMGGIPGTGYTPPVTSSPYSGDPAGELPPLPSESPTMSSTPSTSGAPSGGFQGQGNYGAPMGVGGNILQNAPTPFQPNSYTSFLSGIRTYSPVINEGVFVGGASDRSEVIEGRGGDVSAGNFLQRTESNKEKDFYKKGEKGMKVAEVTGNEVIMPADRQNKIEKALASGDTETPGKIMKQTLAEGKVTKGDASHDSNPMPIMSTGAVLDKNGKDTGLKADSGTGIYHQASKQFKPGMSNSEMTKIIKKNIQSWKKQGKA